MENHKRALYFASRDDSLLRFTDIDELNGLRQQESLTFRAVRLCSESPKEDQQYGGIPLQNGEEPPLLEKLKQHRPAEHGVSADRRRLNGKKVQAVLDRR